MTYAADPGASTDGLGKPSGIKAIEDGVGSAALIASSPNALLRTASAPIDTRTAATSSEGTIAVASPCPECWKKYGWYTSAAACNGTGAGLVAGGTYYAYECSKTGIYGYNLWVN